MDRPILKSELEKCFREVLEQWSKKPQIPTAERVLWEILGRLEKLDKKEEQ